MSTILPSEVVIFTTAGRLAAGSGRHEWPKAVAKITDDAEELLTFFDYPAEHWGHLKTSNPIESTFASVRLRTRVTKGPGSKAAGLAMPSSCWRRHRTAGGRSTAPTWSRWCAPTPASTRG
jgi:hypothetical protein